MKKRRADGCKTPQTGPITASYDGQERLILNKGLREEDPKNYKPTLSLQ